MSDDKTYFDQIEDATKNKNKEMDSIVNFQNNTPPPMTNSEKPLKKDNGFYGHMHVKGCGQKVEICGAEGLD